MPVSGYISGAFGVEKYKTKLKEALQVLRPISSEFDAIAVRGNSGMLFGPTLCLYLNKNLILVRKSQKAEPSHASYLVESLITEGTYLIVDDCIGGGTTVRTITTEIHDKYPGLKPHNMAYLWGWYPKGELRDISYYKGQKP